MRRKEFVKRTSAVRKPDHALEADRHPPHAHYHRKIATYLGLGMKENIYDISRQNTATRAPASPLALQLLQDHFLIPPWHRHFQLGHYQIPRLMSPPRALCQIQPTTQNRSLQTEQIVSSPRTKRLLP
jgi:hypothetical protein